MIKEEQHTCLSPNLSLDVRLAILATSQIKDVEAIRSEMLLQFTNAQKALDAAFASQKSALELKSADNEKHFMALNGEAERLKSMQSTYISREMAEQRFREIIDRIDDLKSSRDISGGRQSVISAIVAFVVSIIIVLINIYFSKH